MMTPQPRRSARLAATLKTPNTTTATAPRQLESLIEQQADSPSKTITQSLNAIMSFSSPSSAPRTPAGSHGVKPPMHEMHPSKAHPSTVRQISTRVFGGIDQLNVSAAEAEPSTPSKAGLPSSPFHFCFTAPDKLADLGPEACRMREELQAETLRIKAELTAKREEEKAQEDVIKSRKIAEPTRKAGRFSAAHMTEFKKMDSILNHPSAFRVQQNRAAPAGASLKRSPSRPHLSISSSTNGSGTTGTQQDRRRLKRTQSKANLDAAEQPRKSKDLKRSDSYLNLKSSESSSHATLKRVESKSRLRIPEPFSQAPHRLRRMSRKADLALLCKDSAQRQAASGGHDETRAEMASSTYKTLRTGDSGSSTLGGEASFSDIKDADSPGKQMIGSSLPRPKSQYMRPPLSSTLFNSPTKPGADAAVKTPAATLTRSPSKTMLGGGGVVQDAASTMTPEVGHSKLPTSASMRNLKAHLDGSRSIRGSVAGSIKGKSDMAVPSGSISKSQGRGLAGLFSPPPATTTVTPTPSIKAGVKPRPLTPETRRAAVAPKTPLRIKSAIPLSKSRPKLTEVFYPSLDAQMEGLEKDQAAVPGDETTDPPSASDPTAAQNTQAHDKNNKSTRADVSKTNFTFRSDRKLCFSRPFTSKDLASSRSSEPQKESHQEPAKSPSTAPAVQMPGSFPTSSSEDPTGTRDKENEEDPALDVHLSTASQDTTVTNQKRSHGVSEEADVEAEAAKRAEKKRRFNGVPNASTLFNSSAAPAVPMKTGMSPVRKTGGGLSLSRLNMLARPKLRK